jgi:plasmid stabilization system protein ParE
MTGRINYTPEAEQQLQDLDAWITKAASAESARRFVSA